MSVWSFVLFCHLGRSGSIAIYYGPVWPTVYDLCLKFCFVCHPGPWGTSFGVRLIFKFICSNRNLQRSLWPLRHSIEMPRGHRGRWPRLAPGRTCQLVAIGMFESGPYGRDGNVFSPRAKRGHCWCWPRLAPAWTCQLLPISMFKPGPYGRDKIVLPQGQSGQKKKKKKKLWSEIQAKHGCFFLFFLYISNATGPLLTFAQSGPGSNMLIATNWYVQTWPLWQAKNGLTPRAKRGQKKKKKKKTVFWHTDHVWSVCQNRVLFFWPRLALGVSTFLALP